MSADTMNLQDVKIAPRISEPGAGRSAGQRSSGHPGLTGREPFAAYVTDPETRSVIADFADARGWSARSVHKGGITSAARTLWVAPPPEILLVDLSDSPDPVEELRTLEQAFRRETRVIALGISNDVTLYRRLIEAGASDYLVKPIALEDLDRALRLTARTPLDRTLTEGRVIGVVGARGGCGSTTIAANLAWAMSSTFRRQSVLLDLDLQFGSTALLFDLQVGPGLREALEEPERIDELFLDRALVHMSETLSVMAAEEALDRTVVPGPNGIAALMTALKERTEALVVDAPSHDPEGLLAVAEACQDLLVVTELTLPGLRDTARLLALIEDAAPGARTLVIANRVPKGTPDVARREFEQELRRPIDVMLPAEDKPVGQAANAGQPLASIASKAKLARALDDLAGKLLDAKPRPTGFLARLRGTG
jgi:pilus assembly protein CpaE